MGRRRRCIKLEETSHEGILYRRSLALLQLVDKIFHPRPGRTFDDDDGHVVPDESRGFPAERRGLARCAVRVASNKWGMTSGYKLGEKLHRIVRGNKLVTKCKQNVNDRIAYK